MAAGVFFGGQVYGEGFFGELSPAPSPSEGGSSGGGGGTVYWQHQHRKPRRSRQEVLFDKLEQTLRELVEVPVSRPEPEPVAVATRRAVEDTLRRLDALATTQALQARVEALRVQIDRARRRQEQILADEDETVLLWL